jgi:hypothetical protein
MRPLRSGRAIGVALAAMLLAACGATNQNASNPSPVAGTPTAAASTQPSASAAQRPSPAPVDPRLVIADFTRVQVRLARIDATDTATVNGRYDGIVSDQVIVLDGTTLQALNRNGTVTKLGQLAATPDWVGVGTVAVNPQLSQWVYAIRDNASNAAIHLGTPTSDRVIATLPSPDGNAYYQPFAWNASGVYMVRQPIGIGGAGPFLEYRFPLAKFNVTTGRVADVSPQCIVHQVLDDGTMICGRTNVGGQIEVRSPSGHSNLIQLAPGGGATADAYISVSVSPDHTRLIAGRNGSKDPVINYQIAMADLTSSSAHAFGPLDYVPDAWLPDGRVIADHRCAYVDWGGGPCNASLDGTYFLSTDGASQSLFFKLVGTAFVVGYV